MPNGAAGVGTVWGAQSGGLQRRKGGEDPPSGQDTPPLTPAVPLLTTKGLVEALATLNAPKGNPGTGGEMGRGHRGGDVY